ncbi:MAG: site-specific integrase [Muribaculaceae bacterium]|nr:site-specific integrase [Muribaculaceae bacterium]
MATVRLKFRPCGRYGREGMLIYQITHERRTRVISSGYRVMAEEWDDSRGTVRASPRSGRASTVMAIREYVRSDMERLGRIDRRMARASLSYTVEDVVDEYDRLTRQCGLFCFMEELIERMRSNGRMRTSETYRSALNSFHQFLRQRPAVGGGGGGDGPLERDDIRLDALSAEIVEDYEGWLRHRGVAPNTVSFYLRILQATYNKAVDCDLTENRRPFRCVYTGIDKTVKRALPLAMMSSIKGLDLSRDSRADFARDMFLMSFYLRGMSFVDMAYLRKSDLREGYVVYRRRKTGQTLSIAWTREMQALLDKYPPNDSEYLLPIIRHTVQDARKAYQNMSYNVNRNLKRVGLMAGVKMPLTMYVARHSWASAARTKGVPLPVISAGMGHDSEKTTRIYLASLETMVVDKANLRIIRSL